MIKSAFTDPAVINVLLEDNHKNLERVDRHIVAALLRTEPDTRSYTLYMANPFDTTQTTLSNTSR